MAGPDLVLDYGRPMRRGPRPRSFGEEAFKVAALATAFIAHSVGGDPSKPLDAFFDVAVVLWAGLAVAVMRRRTLGAGRRPTGNGWRTACTTLLVACLAWMPLSLARGIYVCPHGWRCANQFFGVAWSTNGDPCGDGPYPRTATPWRVSAHWYVYVR